MRVINDLIICDLPSLDVLDMEEIEKIVEHTHNTWQPNRPKEEILENTIQGKRAENVIETALRTYSHFSFLSYDSIRTDGLKKHAPFDGIIFSSDIAEEVLVNSIDRINNDVDSCVGDTGMITIATREALEDEGIYTIEIKSSLLQNPRDYKNMSHKVKEERTKEDYEELCDYLLDFYDYFVYPHFCRSSSSITNLYKYSQFVRRTNTYEDTDKRLFLYRLMKDEFNNACMIYTRVFFDILSDEVIIPGYVMKTRFFV